MPQTIGSFVTDDEGYMHQLLRVDLKELLDSARNDHKNLRTEFDWLHEASNMPGVAFDCEMKLKGMIEGDLIIEFISFNSKYVED